MPIALLPCFAATLIPGYGVQRIPHLAAFLPETNRLVLSRGFRTGVDSVAGWGFKSTSAHARAIARSRGLPYLALEDGFFRSVGHGESGAPTLSLVVDEIGIYYDARQPSRLEHILADRGWEKPALIARAEAARRMVVTEGLSKTNADPRLPSDALPPRDGRRRILVVDQTLNDASIAGALASRETFARMLATARADEPEAWIIVRRHPVVAAGIKRGCLDAEELGGTIVLDQPARAADVLAEVDAVYTVSSLMGFEALLRDLPVRCFGLPFYAGWGLTRDEIVCARRGVTRTPAELFAAACILYTRYVDPLTGLPCALETALEQLRLFRDRSDRNAGYTAALGFSPWKHDATRRLLASCRGTLEFHDDAVAAASAARAVAGRVVVWGSKQLPASDVPVWRMEDGFLRSAGLGSDLVPPQSAILDDLGIYYDPATMSRLEAILESGISEPLLERARNLRQALLAAGLSKYCLNGGPLSSIDGAAPMLVVGQVENDQSLLLGSPVIRTNLALLEAVRRDHPRASILYKPHPDVAHGTRAGSLRRSDVMRFADAIVPNIDIAALLDQVGAVATMTSLAGFEALLRGLPVHTYGLPFYAGWGLTNDALSIERRRRTITLDELIAAALLSYSIYVDPVTGLPCSAEHLVAVLAARPRGRLHSKPARMLARFVRRIRPQPPRAF